MPNDMHAAFGGSAWEWVPEVGQYYFHQFAPEQPDLNWENPKVRRAIYDMILWWMDRGVGGFRLDVIDQIAKEPDGRRVEELHIGKVIQFFMHTYACYQMFLN